MARRPANSAPVRLNPFSHEVSLQRGQGEQSRLHPGEVYDGIAETSSRAARTTAVRIGSLTARIRSAGGISIRAMSPWWRTRNRRTPTLASPASACSTCAAFQVSRTGSEESVTRGTALPACQRREAAKPAPAGVRRPCQDRVRQAAVARDEWLRREPRAGLAVSRRQPSRRTRRHQASQPHARGSRP